ncbi:MAG: rhomboid family intramembrane serine protease [Comamonadaceae bacterium]|nr:MAG: rhomboid family intramembrane serine protease [Comamonadaceae bacterium]
MSSLLKDFQRDNGFAPTQLMAREFRASWRSPTGIVGISFVLFGLGALAAVWLGNSPGLRFMMGVCTVFFLGFSWLCLRMLFGNRPVLRVGPEGISAIAIKNGPLPWSSIADIREMTFQNNRSLVISLTPAAAPKRWWGGTRKEQAVPLVPIQPELRDDAVAAVFEGFSLYGGEQSVLAVKAHEEETASTLAFEKRLDEMTPTTWALFLMVGLNALAWLANLYGGLNAMKPLPAQLFAWGANSASAVVEDRQYWRLLTNTFLHGGLMHLALNMLGLWEAGRQLNRMYGNAQFLLIYLASALAGSALSLHFSAQQSVSVGASGAVFGVLGAILVAMYQHRGQVPKQTSKRIFTSQGVFLVYALAQGFGRQGVDNAAHVGGLLCGSLLAWLLVEKIDTSATPTRRGAFALAGTGLSAAAIAALLFTTPAPAVHHRQLFAFQAGLNRLAPAMSATEKAFQTDGKAYRSGTLSEAAFTDAMRTRHLPAYRAIQRELAPLEIPGSDVAGQGMRDLKRSNTLVVELMELQLAQTDAVATPGSDPGVGTAAAMRMQAIGKELQDIQARFAVLAQNSTKPVRTD